MSIELNQPAVRQARALVREGAVVRDERDAWSESAPTPDEENAFIEREGWTAFAHWHLGIDKSANPETKQAYTFPYGDFRRVHRSGVIAGESRAGQYDHTEIERELKRLLTLIDSEGGADS